MQDIKVMFRRTMTNVARMDGFSGLLLDSRQRWAVHADTLTQHHERLTKLERGP
ncbi:MAG: hypothetical protein ACHQ51_00290 [Elusimicrobiota bacterium]